MLYIICSLQWLVASGHVMFSKVWNELLTVHLYLKQTQSAVAFLMWKGFCKPLLLRCEFSYHMMLTHDEADIWHCATGICNLTCAVTLQTIRPHCKHIVPFPLQVQDPWHQGFDRRHWWWLLTSGHAPRLGPESIQRRKLHLLTEELPSELGVELEF